MKRLWIVVLMILLGLGLAVAGNGALADTKVAALKGPTAMGMVKMMADENQGYDFTIYAAIDEITTLLVKGEIDIAAVPANLASVLYNNTQGGVKVLAIHTLGVLYIVENGDTISSVEDLRGRTIYASGKGATPEHALNYLLTSNGIDPLTDVTIEYKSEHSECLAALVADENGIAMLPQPFVATAQMKVPTIRIALDLNEEWEKIQGDAEEKSALITGVLIARTAFVEENPEVIDAFMTAYQQSINYVDENVEDAAKLIGQYDIVTEEVAKAALPYCRIVFIEGEEMVEKLSGYLKVLYDQDPASVGGAIADEAFYYQR